MSEERPRPRPARGARAIMYFAFGLLYLPLATVVIYSFLGHDPDGGGLTITGEWYAAIMARPALLDALELSLSIAAVNTLAATILGTMAALAMERARFPFWRALDICTMIPFVIPELVFGLSLLIWFVMLKITLGYISIVLAHITFSMSYVVINVRTRLRDFDRSLEEAARDLGASSWQVLWQITLPLIYPGILSGALMAFTLSFDDFMVTFFTNGVNTDTLPIKLYGLIKFGITKEIYALATLLLGATLVVISGLARLRRGGSQVFHA